MTAFASLYDGFKNSTVHIGRNAVRDAVLKATGVQRVHIHAATMNIAVCRGMYFSPRNATHGLEAYVQHESIFQATSEPTPVRVGTPSRIEGDAVVPH